MVHTNARRRRSSLNEAIVSLYSTLAAAAPRWDCSAVVVSVVVYVIVTVIAGYSVLYLSSVGMLKEI